MISSEFFVEVEKDELFETAGLGKQAGHINHKEFITWREFMTYFNDYREIEDRNKKAKEIAEIWGKLPDRDRAQAMRDLAARAPAKYRET
jgi:hypothetical protein